MIESSNQAGRGKAEPPKDHLLTTVAINAICSGVTCILVFTLLWRQSRLEHRLSKSSDVGALAQVPSAAGLVAQASAASAAKEPVDPLPAALPPPDPRELDEPVALGQSVGLPRDGSLFDGERFESGPGYIVRNPQRAWATRESIAMIRSALEQTRREHPFAVPLIVGDLSTRTGGPLSGHHSHESGRDADLGLFRRALAPLRSKPKRLKDPAQLKFRRANKNTIQLPVLLDFVLALHEHKDEPGGISWIMLDYRIQEWLVDYAKRHDYSESALTEVFQVPHGPAYQNSLVRHYPGHMNHMHLRFSCPASDPYCQAPPKRPDLAEKP